MIAPPTREIEPLVPRLPTDESAPLADGGERRPLEFDPQPPSDHAPNDRHREEIEPLVPDLG